MSQSSKICLCGLPKRGKAFIAVMNKWIIVYIYQKCQGMGRKLLGSQGSTDLPVVIENRQ